MNKRQNNSVRASALQITLSIALLSVSAILFASSFKAAPTAPPDGFYPPLPVTAAPEPGGFYPQLPSAPVQPLDLNPLITISAPVANLPATDPIATVYTLPVNTTVINGTTTGGLNYVGFQ